MKMVSDFPLLAKGTQLQLDAVKMAMMNVTGCGRLSFLKRRLECALVVMW
jgi:hypothetical protein